MRRRPLVLALALTASGCPSPMPSQEGLSAPTDQPAVFDVIRASNSQAALEKLRDRYQEEVEHAHLLEARIGELIAAEEGLALERSDRMKALQTVRDQARALADEQEKLTRQLEAATQGKAYTTQKLQQAEEENAALEKKIAAETLKRDELRKKLAAVEHERQQAQADLDRKSKTGGGR